MGKLFGTDGIRGTANTYPMTPDIVVKVGQALGYIIKRNPPRNIQRPRVVIGKDTRLPGYMVEQALTSGLNSMGIDVQLVGPLPTPAIGFLTRNMRADAGIVISASHNPFYDNGIKIFGPDGYKISSLVEDEIEELVLNKDLNSLLVKPEKLGRAKRIEDAEGRYIVEIKNSFPLEHTLEGMRIVLDCANGAAYKVAPSVFQELGAEVVLLGASPDGFNVNDKTGALYPAQMCEAVLKYRADIGISLDGDADRVIMADETGRIVNGDHVLAICARHLKSKNKLPKNTIVATVMSNFGLDKAMNEIGIQVVRVQVGDKYVVEEMRKIGATVGGEQSGHVIILDHSTTGDGCVASLSVLKAMKDEGKKLSELRSWIEDVPQVLINTKVTKKQDLETIPGYNDLLKKIESELKQTGRIMVRFSGTENMVRVLVEGTDRGQINKLAEEMSNFLKSKLS